MHPQIQQLLTLQKIDVEMDAISTDITQIPKDIQTQKNEIAKIKTDLEEQKKTGLNLQVRKKDLEIELTAHEDKIRKNERELGSVKSNTAYSALLAEIQTAKTQKQKLEDEILDLLLQIDQCIAKIPQMESASAAAIENIQKIIALKEQNLSQLQSALNDKKEQRQNYIQNVPSAALNLYKNIAKHLGASVLAHLQGDICSGCHTNLTPSMLNEVGKNKELFTCENCSRIVYIPEAVKPA